ncbi:hypothetical protein LLH23_05720 [bacterium]|nr:hypothetical protein [bacterium]
MDAALAGDKLYVIGPQRLWVCSVSDPQHPRVLGSLDNLGNNRQIVVRGDRVFVTAREDGLFIIDASDAAAPRLISHYNTIELATGLEVSGSIVYVACRHYGVELVDVRDPAQPRHLSTVRTGEAQSCVVRGCMLYVGVWGTREVVICDVGNPRLPTVVSHAPLGGYGDGLDVRGGHCFAATGHHHGTGRPSSNDDPRYGAGHGLEVLDVSDARQPKTVARVPFPPFYRLRVDMWDAQLSGEFVYVGDNHGGLFVIEVKDPAHPRVVAHHRLPYIEQRQDTAPIGGFAIGQGVVYAAGLWTDLHVLEAPMARPVAPQPGLAVQIPPATPPQRDGWSIYQPEGQVFAVTARDDYAFVACGVAGLHRVSLWPELKRLAVYPTEGFAVDAKQRGGLLYVAEGRGGLSIWRIGAGGELALQGRFTVPGRSVKQVVVPPGLALALIDVGANTLVILDVSDPAHPREVFHDQRLGLLYGYNITDGLFEGRYAACTWHVSGTHWFDLTGGPQPVFSGDVLPGPMHPTNGLAVMPDGVHGLLTEPHGQYTIITRGDRRPLGQLPHHGLAGHRLTGKPVVVGNTLYLTDRAEGHVTIVDLGEPKQPRLLDEFTIAGNPCLMAEHRGHALLPAGYDGLWVSREPVR